jgi:hypothetical protein
VAGEERLADLEYTSAMTRERTRPEQEPTSAAPAQSFIQLGGELATRISITAEFSLRMRRTRTDAPSAVGGTSGRLGAAAVS